MWRYRDAIPAGAAALLCAGAALGQEKGFYFYQRVEATANELAWITRLEATAGYNVNRYLGFEAGVPVYFVRPQPRIKAAPAVERADGLGNVRVTARLAVSTAAVDYFGAATVTAPTGDEDKGLSTGKVTWDWSSHFERSFGRITPFGAVGVANTITDTPFFVRPFSSQGLVTRLEGGVRVGLLRRLSAGALLYTIQPSGEQTVISRLLRGGPAPPLAPAGRGRRRGVFEQAPRTVGPAELVRERGGAVWISAGPFGIVDFQLGYSRSAPYALDSLFVGIGANLGSLIRQRRL
ncbi:MAG: hypothetical protein RMK57_13890 [Bryobacterales bacterium]|nr:hypothetical protein [Bryobacteraceae bacterium]MDW8355612.1 hypothetical protein [Bryobacterales bacterium]